METFLKRNSLLAKEGMETGICRKCGGNGLLISPQGAVAEASVCECSQRCLLCHDSRYIFQRDELGREVATMCDCERRRVRARLYNEAGIPGRYADAVFNDAFRDRGNKNAFNTFKTMARDYQRGDKGILLMGAPGVGKTWMISAFIRELIFTHGIQALFQDFFHLLKDLRSGYSQDKPESELIDPMVRVEVLVIDELGKGRNTPWEQNILDVIISQRYNNQKTTLFTSNYTTNKKTTLVERVRPKEAPGGEADREVSDTLQERVGSRIYSRLQEMCHFDELRGPDRREQHEGAGHS